MKVVEGKRILEIGFAHLLASIATKTTLVVRVAQCSDHLALYEAVASGTFGTKRLLVAVGAMVCGAFVQSVCEETTLRQRSLALYK